MKVMIDIPKEFEEDLKCTFQDFFNRIIADITYSLNNEELMCCGNYERETAEMFLSAFENATIISDNATNGEVLCILFPNMHYTLSDKSTRVVTNIGCVSSFDMDWWNAQYKKEVEE